MERVALPGGQHQSALSPEARDLLDKIFQTDPKKRITIPQIMQHPWCGLSPEAQCIPCLVYLLCMLCTDEAKQFLLLCIILSDGCFTKSAWHMSKGTSRHASACIFGCCFGTHDR